MSFGKAKRFNYKPIDPTPSPADYAICSKFDKGHFISKCARFSNMMRDDKCTFVICPRSANHYARCSTPNSDDEVCTKDELDALKRKIIGFNRNDITRHSFRRKPSRTNKSSTQSKYKSNNSNNPPRDYANEEQGLYESEGYFDEDYDSFTSSEEIDNLKRVEEYEFNEVCKAFERMQTRNSIKREKRPSSFEQTVLKKLEKIDNNVEDFREEFEKLYQNALLQTSFYDQNGTGANLHKKEQGEYHPIASEIDSTIKRAIKNFEEEFKKKRKSILYDNEINIKKLINEIHASSKKSSDQMRKLCKKTAEKLSNNVNGLLKNNVNIEFPTVKIEFPSDIENISVAEEAREKCDEFNYENICKVLSDHLQESQVANDVLESDYMELSTKYSGTQQMLDVQGTLIEVLKDELADLKQSLYKNNK